MNFGIWGLVQHYLPFLFIYFQMCTKFRTDTTLPFEQRAARTVPPSLSLTSVLRYPFPTHIPEMRTHSISNWGFMSIQAACCFSKQWWVRKKSSALSSLLDLLYACLTIWKTFPCKFPHCSFPLLTWLQQRATTELPVFFMPLKAFAISKERMMVRWQG